MTPRAAWWAARYTSAVLDDVRSARDIRAQVEGDAPDDLMVKVYRNGKREVLVGLWRTSFGADTCKPVAVSVRVPGLRAQDVELVDLLYGVRQRAQLQTDAGGVTVPGVLVGDWPVFLRFSGSGPAMGRSTAGASPRMTQED
jgi:hypothetical protein